MCLPHCEEYRNESSEQIEQEQYDECRYRDARREHIHALQVGRYPHQVGEEVIHYRYARDSGHECDHKDLSGEHPIDIRFPESDSSESTDFLDPGEER